jgi:hypothetical protein
MTDLALSSTEILVTEDIKSHEVFNITSGDKDVKSE